MQAAVDVRCLRPGFVAKSFWNGRTKSGGWFDSVRAALREMAGPRTRCMYCGDSRASDVEHYWPKTPFPQRMFVWANLLLCCTDCGRQKSDVFPLDSGGTPLLIDPTDCDPWLHLDFDPVTGNLVPRFLPNGEADPRGKATLEVLKLDRKESLSLLLRRTHKKLESTLAAFVSAVPAEAPAALLEEDDFVLAGWVFRGAGADSEPFKSIRERHPAHWECCAKLYE